MSACGQDALIYYGFGTEKVESTVAQIFPKAVVRRMDGRFHDGARRRIANVKKFSHWQDRHFGRYTNDRQVCIFERDVGWNHQTLILPCICPISEQAERTFQLLTQSPDRRPRRNGGRSFCADLHAVSPSIQLQAP